MSSGAQLTLTIESVEQDQLLQNALSLLVSEYNTLGEIVSEIFAFVPDLSKCRLTLTGDIVATVNALEDRTEGDSYTTNRGAGHVGGVTLPRDDATFDIVLDAHVLVHPPGAYEDLDGLVENNIKTGKHLARHEAGHVLLHLRGEDGDSFREVG